MLKDISASLILVTAMLAALIVFKHFSGKAMPPSWKYRLGYLYFLILLLPFIPCAVPKGENAAAVSHLAAEAGTVYQAVNAGSVIIESFAVNKTADIGGFIIFALWAAGAAVAASVFMVSAIKLSEVLKGSKTADERTQQVFDKCLKDLGIKDRITLKTGKVSSPMVFGIFRTYIIIPEGDIPDGDLKNIFMHEMIHYKRGDVAINYAICLFEIVYWFDPFVWAAFKGLKADMETACDEAVMEKTGDSYGYGMTIIRFAKKRDFVSAAGMGGSRSQIVKRVKAAAEFKKATAKQRAISAVVFIMSACFILSALPAVSVNAIEKSSPEAGITADMADKNITEVDLSEYFDGINGSFVLYDLNSDSFSVYNSEEASKRVSPDSTYKIYSALAALESGAISPEENTILWNGEKYPFEQWEKDQDLDSAMKNSVNWYFDRLNESCGKELQNIFTAFGYGNCDMNGGKDFWMESSLKVSPMEQVEALKSLYLNENGYRHENVEAVKDSLEISPGFYGKTGSGMVNGKEVNGWFIGFVETEDNVWFFALNMNDDDQASGSKAAQTAVEILRDRGIIEHEI